MAVTYRASSSAVQTSLNAAVSCNYPTGTAVGDVVIAFVTVQRTNTTAITVPTPSGWTLLHTSSQSNSTNGTMIAVFGQFYVSGSSQSFAAAGTNTGQVISMHSLYGADSTTPIAGVTSSIDTTSRSVGYGFTMPTITGTTGNQVLWCRSSVNPGAFGGSSATWDASATEVLDTSNTMGFSFYQNTHSGVGASYVGPGTTPAAVSTQGGFSAAATVMVTIAIQQPQSATVSGTEDAAVTDAATGLSVTTGVATDTASGTESSSQTVSRSPDTALASEPASTVTAATGFRTDTAAATDSWTTLVASVPGTDTAATTESAYVSNAIQVSDTAVAAEAASVVRVSGSADAATATDKALPFPFDYVVGGESPSSLRVSGSEDTATASDSAFATNAAQASPDAATVTENSSKVYQSRSDSAVGTDSSSLTATANGSDSAAVTESARIIIVVTGDSAAGSESSKVFLTRVDTAAETDAATIAVTVFGSDSAGAVETSIESNRSASDQFVWTESAFKSISGQLQASRLVVVQPESRVVTVDFEGEYTPDTYGIVSETVVGEDVIAGTSKIARRIIVEREFRLVMIGAEV